jgi:hypothetical protein
MLEDAKDMIVSGMLPFCEKTNQHYFRCFFLLQLAMIYLESSQEDPSFAIPSILDCLALSEELSIDSIHASALSLLAKIHFMMGNVIRAKALIEASMPVLLKHGHETFIGHAWMTLAKCMLAETCTSDGSNRLSILKHALFQLQCSAECFRNTCDVSYLCEVYYLIAHVCNKLPFHQGLRDEASRTFVSLAKRKNTSVLPTSFESLSQMLTTNIM